MHDYASQSEAVLATIESMSDRLGEGDSALVALVVGLARSVDVDSSNAALWREYRAALTALLVTGGDDVDDDAAEFLISVTTPGRRAKVGDG